MNYPPLVEEVDALDAPDMLQYTKGSTSLHEERRSCKLAQGR
jgi:hypothetical protein